MTNNMNTLTNAEKTRAVEMMIAALSDDQEVCAMLRELLSLRAQLAELLGQEPYGWDCEGALVKTVSCRDSYQRSGVAVVPLFSNPVPPAASQPVTAHIGSKNTLDSIIGFIKSDRNPTLGDYKEVSDRLFQDNCQSLATHVIRYIESIGQELEDFREDGKPTPHAYAVPKGWSINRVWEIEGLDKMTAYQAHRAGYEQCLGQLKKG